MIADGFDYGDGFTLGEPWSWTQWKSLDGRWVDKVSGFGYTKRCRRPMTEAEKQAEKAKDEKVKDQMIRINIPVHYQPGDPTCTAHLPVSELARVAQLPEVVAEVERQRKARTVDRMDWFWYHGTIRRCSGVSTSGPQLTDNQGSTLCVSECHKINDPAFIAFLEAGVTP